MTRIVLHIDKLVLRGVNAADADALSAAISHALAGELEHHALDAPFISQGDRPRIQAGSITAATSLAGTGQAIAERIVAGGQA